MKNLWLYTEERPRVSTIQTIVGKFASDRNLKFAFSQKGKILPLMKKGLFTFVYKIEGIKCERVKDIFVQIISGSGSFVDHIVFYSEQKPLLSDQPIYLIEETKTDDKESRNTGVYQRCSKFVYSEFFYPKVPKIMLYNLKISQKIKPTLTYTFGTKILKTLGVQIMGKQLDEKLYKPFQSVDQLISLKNAMPPTKNGVSVRITKRGNKIEISSRLEKAGKLGSDPSIGMTSIISSCLRKLGWTGRIVITLHGLKNQKSVGIRNKFILIANKIGIELDGLTIPKSELVEEYWKIENNTEKLGTIFTSIICEEFANAVAIYENHQGCERGYFYDPAGKPLTIAKYQEGKRNAYKSGDKTSIIYIPDLVIFDPSRNEVINIEGKKYSIRKDGIKELKNYTYFEKKIIKPFYKPNRILRTVVIFGSKLNKIKEKEIGLMLNEEGLIVLNKNTPEIIKEAMSKLLA